MARRKWGVLAHRRGSTPGLVNSQGVGDTRGEGVQKDIGSHRLAGVDSTVGVGHTSHAHCVNSEVQVLLPASGECQAALNALQASSSCQRDAASRATSASCTQYCC